MILQALTEYYERKSDDPESDIAPPGWERKELPFLIVISQDGRFVDIADTREATGKALRAKTFLVPAGSKKTSGIKANLLWDNVEYALGIPTSKQKNGQTNIDRIAKQHETFMARLAAVPCESVSSVLKFLNASEEISRLQLTPLAEELTNSNPFVSFLIAGSQAPVFRQQDFREAYTACQQTAGAEISFCLVTGRHDVPARLHNAIKGVRGAQSTGSNIVSFNFASALSFGKSQGLNAPIGEQAMFAYTTALNSMLAKDSPQKIQIGDATTVFWASKENQLESEFAAFWEEPPKDNPDRLTKAVATLFQSIENGSFTQDSSQTLFYVLGLSPNAARLAIRFWHAATAHEMAIHIGQYFADLRIIHGPWEKDDLPLWRLLCATAPLGKTENVSPVLAGETMRAILSGSPFPVTLLHNALLRCKAEHEVSYPRAKLIKGFLNRQTSQERSLHMSLDKDNDHIGYRLGRLFAVLEKIQMEANGDVNAGIRVKFYASASSSPVSVFGNLMRLKNFHLDKLTPGRRISLEKIIGEILYHNPNQPGIQAFPAHMNLDQQGRFAIGYYHQMQELFEKKSTDNVQ